MRIAFLVLFSVLGANLINQAVHSATELQIKKLEQICKVSPHYCTKAP